MLVGGVNHMHLTVHRLQRHKRFVTKYSAAKKARVESRADQRERGE